MIREVKKTVQQIAQDKERKIMETVARKAGYYRENPHRYVSEVLGIRLKLFQKILLWAMMYYNYIMYLAARGYFFKEDLVDNYHPPLFYFVQK